MSATAFEPVREIDLLRHQAQMAHQVVRLNVDGLAQNETLIQPKPAGNCLNWVVGHLVAIYDQVLPLLGQKPARFDEVSHSHPDYHILTINI